MSFSPRLAYAVYNLLLHAAVLPASPLVLAGAALTGRRLARTWRGQAGLELPPAPACERSIWIQASSVGEARACPSLVRALKAAFPGLPVLLTGSTPEGLKMARQGSGADLFAPFPFDFPWIVSRWFDTYRPSLCLVVETEIWPNFIRECRRRNVPVALVSGRLSPKRMPRYRKLAGFYGAFLDGFSLLLMQTQEDAARALELGADPARVRVAGDLKFDNLPQPPPAARIPPGRYLVAGSTHPGESEDVLDAFAALRGRYPDLGLVIAPRHPETADASSRYAEAAGLAPVRRSAGGEPGPGRVLILDTVGELASLYAAASVAFVGGSLVRVGGHSLLEPASLGKPVLHGPHIFHFEEAARLLAEAGGSRVLSGPQELAPAVSELLERPQDAAAMGARAREAVSSRMGATGRIVEQLRALNSGPPA